MQTETSQPNQNPKPAEKKSRVLRVIAIVVGCIIGLMIVAAGVGYLMYAGKVQSIITEAANQYIKDIIKRDARSKGNAPLSVKLGLIDYAFFARTLEVKDIAIKSGTQDNTDEFFMDIQVPSVKITGVNPWDVLFGEGLALGDITITEPSVLTRPAKQSAADSVIAWQARVDAASKDTAAVKLPRLTDVDSLVGSLLGTILPSNIKPLWIASFAVNEATYVVATTVHGGNLGGSMTGVNIRLNGLSIRDTTETYKAVQETFLSVRRWVRASEDADTIELYGGSVSVNDRDSAMHVDSIKYRVPNTSLTYASGVHISFRQRGLRIDSFSLAPTISDAEVFAKTVFRSDRIRVGAKYIVLKDVDTKGLVDGTALKAHTLDFSSFYIDVLSNSRGKKKIGAKQTMPYQLIRSIPFTLGLDSIRIGNTSIWYGELHANSKVPAILQFSRIGFLVTGLSNDPEVQKREPVKIFGKGAFQKNGVMDLELTVPLNVTQNTFDAKGTLKEMDLTTFNSFLPVAENIRAKSGWVKKASFELKVRGRQSSGNVNPQYIDFELEVLNKSSKKVGFWEGIASFLANWLKIKGENVPGPEMKVGKIAYTIPADASVIQTLWFPVRAGLGDVIGF